MPETITKQCTICKRWKPLSEFHRDHRIKSGRKSRCKTCVARYDSEHHDEISARQHLRYIEHCEEKAEYNQEYYAEHREEKAEHNRRYYAENREAILGQSRRWRQENPERIAEGNRRHVARRAGLLATLTVAQWQKILEEWGFRCAYCGKDESQFDGPFHHEHIIPVDQGGGYTAENIIPACPGCNLKKGARTPEQAGMSFMLAARDNKRAVFERAADG